MKNLFLVFVCLFFSSTTAFCQEKINTDNLIGYWQPNEESAQVFFWKDVNGKLQLQEICGSTGEAIDTLSLVIKDNIVIAKSIYIPNHWVTESRYAFKDKNTLVCEITGDGEGTIIFTKVK